MLISHKDNDLMRYQERCRIKPLTYCLLTADLLILYLTTALTAPLPTVPTTLTAVEPTATPTSTAVLTTDTAALATETTAQPFNRLSAKHNDSGNNRRAKWDIMGFTYRLTILHLTNAIC
jgi:hypothetical protein